MSFTPNSTVQLFKDIGIDSSYENTLKFSSRQAQETYFSGLTSITLTNQYRVEKELNSIKIEKPYSQVYTVGYMRFKNISYEGKWFYAFVTSVEYVNDTTSRINYEIDVMQTWLAGVDYTLGQCFVEREHSSSDAIGDNLVKENLELGEYVISDSKQCFFNNENYGYVIVALFASDTDGDELVEFNEYDYLKVPCEAYVFDPSNSEQMNALSAMVKALYANNKGDRILNMYTVPALMVDYSRIDSISRKIMDGSTGKERTLSGCTLSSTSALDGYVPKNNKCYTYPYNFEVLVTTDGNSMNTRYEFCDGTPEYNLLANIMSPVELTIRRNDYRGSDSSTVNTMDFSEKISMTNFPVCAWQYDSYQMWLNNEMPKQIIGLGSSALGSAVSVGASTANPYMAIGGAGVSLLTNAASLMWESEVRSRNNIQTAGTLSGSGADYGHQLRGINIYRYTVNSEYAKIIDNFFQMYGYACHKVKVPNTSARSRWTYTKTSGCAITSPNLPVTDRKKIESIFNHGIRFWKNQSEIGNYSLSNSPS